MPVRTRYKDTLRNYLDSDGIVDNTELTYTTPLEAILSTSPTFDYDSDVNVYDMSNTIETMDADHNLYWSDDDTEYNNQINDRAVP